MVILRRPSDDAAESNTRARRTGARCRDYRRATGSRCVADATGAARDRRRCRRMPSRPRTWPCGPRPADRQAAATVRMPLPPPPATAFTTSGYPIRCASAVISASVAASANAASVPGTTGTPAAIAACRAAVLLPMSAMARGVGPTKIRPASTQAWAKSSFSARNP